MCVCVCVCVLNNPDDMHQLIHCFSILPSKATDINLITEKKTASSFYYAAAAATFKIITLLTNFWKHLSLSLSVSPSLPPSLPRRVRALCHGDGSPSFFPPL